MLKHLGFKLAVVTNKSHAAAIALLRTLSFLDLFEVVIGGDSVPTRKPDPAPILSALLSLRADATQAIMVGDNYHDVLAARAAGVRVIAVTYGYSHQPHAELGADWLAQTFEEIGVLVRRLTKQDT